MPSALDELLRYDSPVHISARRPTTAISIAGQTFPANAMVYLALAAANRDPERFAEPERLDLTRKNNRHLSFSQGPHYCLGAALAKMEATAALSTLLRRTRALALDEGPLRWRVNPILRGLEALPIRFEPVL